ncbi:MAG: tetratricopeptide repeat protein [Rikenellaceae bacterium]
MRKYILSFLMLVTAFSAYSQNDAKAWDRANAHYINEEYQQAVEVYDSLLKAGNTSHKLFYNLANAHFKLSNIGESVLCYNKALKIEPSDEDTKHNLAIVNTYVKDKIELVPVFILTRWSRSLSAMMSSNSWAVFALICLVVALGFVLLYLLSKNSRRRKLGFFSAIIFLFLTCNALIFSNQQREDIVRPSKAVIMSESVAVKSSPSKTSTDIFVIHEGTTVRILQRMSNWCEISIADGNKGWVERSSVKMI